MFLRATDHRLRGLLALLTVVAAFAFQMRVGGMVELPSPAPSGVPMAGHDMARMPGGSAVAAPGVLSAHGQPPGHGHSGDKSGQESHNHAAHCPFCVTGAFALEAGVLPMPTAPPRLAAQSQRFAPVWQPTAVRHVDARAPPVLL